MSEKEKMRHCPSCDVYVGVCDGEVIVVTGDAFRGCLDYYAHIQDPHVAEVYEPVTWREVAIVRYHSAWFEPDESGESYEWYRSRGLEELHDHSLWLELVSQ
jgi:hypothetical protein